MISATLYVSAPKMAFAQDVRSAETFEIDVTNKNDGYIRARSKTETSKKLKLRTRYAKPNGTNIEYTYDLNGGGAWETYSLQSGNGEYTILILENVDGSRYRTPITIKIDVQYSRENAPFLVPTQHVNFTPDSNTVKKARELSKNAGTDLGKVESIYKYIVETIKYDKDKADKISSGKIIGYMPTVDDTLDTSKGICFDFSSFFAAMLRSQNIPTKLIMGYVATSPQSYHAWNEVYIENIGWIRIRSQVYFDGKDWGRMDSTFASSNTTGKRTQFISEDKNYMKDKEY